jgi:polysaccharide chain length determinant protein (PEP-CTERM system associated)
VTNAIAAFYVAQNDKMRSEEATQTTKFLRLQLDEAKKELERQEQNVRAFNNRHVGELPQQIELNLAALDRMNTQLRINGERQLRAMEERHRLAEDTMIIDSGSDVRIIEPDRARERLQIMQQELQQMEARMTTKHPDVQRMRDEIALLERDIAATPSNGSPSATPLPASPAASALLRSRKNAIQSLDAELQRLKGEDDKLRDMISGLERKLSTMPERQQEFTAVTRDHQAAKEQYDSLLKRFDEAQLVENMETDRQGERFRVLEPAMAPEGPSAPNRLQLILIGLVLATGAAFMSVLVAEQFDTTFHSVDELRAFTRVPVLATIPEIATRRGARLVRTILVTGSILLAIGATAAAAAYLARGNEQLVRLLVRGA